MIKAILVDDEMKSRLTLQKLLESYCPEISVAGSCGDIGEAYDLVKNSRPDVLFLDIEMAGSTGFDLVEKFDAPEFHIIFVTAHSQYAVKAFKFSATDYLMKPVDVDELKTAVKKVKDRLSETKEKQDLPKKMLLLRTSESGIYVDPAEIVHLEADGSYTIISMQNGEKHYLSQNIGTYESQLDAGIFVRIHKSHIINLKHLKKANQYEGFAEMTDGRRLNISRRNKDHFFKLLKKNNRS
jgi:two-component system, LytTR family, response regulator